MSVADNLPAIPDGYSQEEWDQMTPQEQQMAWDNQAAINEYETNKKNQNDYLSVWKSLQESMKEQQALNIAAILAAEQRRIAASKKAQKQAAKGYRRARKALIPYAATGVRLLPKMENAYDQGLKIARAASQTLASPRNMGLLGAPAPLPDYLKR